ncbi:MAG: NAD(P)/FAD-dependent oxidoreductase [Theionarchaea archaeon]|nr:NAD(P)/FAD-dependent oxidoreductase [Theionarchaea archaeon]
MLSCDILVVGAGPAGLSAALEASRAGVHVVVAEKKKTIGQPVRCAELMPKSNFLNVEVKGGIVQEIRKARIFLPDGGFFDADLTGYMVNRTVLEQDLAREAGKKDAHILMRTQCTSKKGENVILRQSKTTIEISPQVIIGADGPRSTVGEWMGQINGEFCIALQYEIPLVAPSDCAEFYFDSKFFGGYGWLFPKGKTANVGIAVKYPQQPRNVSILKRLLKEFGKKMHLAGKTGETPISTTGGLIPVGEPLDTVKDNMVLVGDAAGQTNSLTGGGISQAVVSGKTAGIVAAEAIKESNMHILHIYGAQLDYIFGDELRKAYVKRQFLESHWDDLDSIIRKEWIVF